MNKTVDINNTECVVNHIRSNTFGFEGSEEIRNLVHCILDKLDHKRHKGIDKKMDKLKVLGSNQLDKTEQVVGRTMFESLISKT